MTPRPLNFMILAAVVAISSFVSAQDEKRSGVRTWKTVVDYVFANGTDKTLKAPIPKNLGFNLEAISTKAL